MQKAFAMPFRALAGVDSAVAARLYEVERGDLFPGMISREIDVWRSGARPWRMITRYFASR